MIDEFLQRDERLARYEQHKIEIVVDRLVLREGHRAAAHRLARDRAATRRRRRRGRDRRREGAEPETLTFSQHLACPVCHTSYDEPAPRNFSFNSPYGACETCDGLGTTFEVDPELVIPDPEQSIRDGAISPWRSAHTQYFQRMLESVADSYDIDLDAPWEKLTAKQQKVDPARHQRQADGQVQEPLRPQPPVLHRVRGRDPVDQAPPRGRRERLVARAVRGLHAPGAVPARAAGPGSSRSSLAVTVGGKHIAEVCDMSIGESAKFLAGARAERARQMIAERVTKEINARLGFLLDVGLDYLTLSRSAGTLAGGEAQRIRLASQIGSGLVGTLYVLDEPSIGLHQRDNRRLIDTLTRLRDLGNTVIVVEHDEETIRESDWIVDIGPGAGEHGGEVVYSGPFTGIVKVKESITGQYLSGKQVDPGATERRRCPALEKLTSTAPASTTSATSRSTSRSGASSPSPACPARASRRSCATSCCRC